jgi:glucokinase
MHEERQPAALARDLQQRRAMKAGSYWIGIDLGGTKLAGVVIDAAGVVLAAQREPSDSLRPADELADDVAALAERLRQEVDPDGIRGVAVGVAGQVDRDRQRVHRAPNLGWHELPFGGMLKSRLDALPVGILNDVQAATWGEWKHGAARDERDAVCLFIGTGVGGGIILGGSPAGGAGGSAGELGHLPIDRNGPACRCGNRGCLESYAGGWAIGRRAFDAVASHPAAGAAMLEIAGGDASRITARVVAEAAHAGDPLARALVREAADALATAAVGIVNALNPGVLLLGGGVAEGLPELIEVVRERVSMWALPSAAADVRILRARLGANAGAIGAAAWLRDGAAG